MWPQLRFGSPDWNVYCHLRQRATTHGHGDPIAAWPNQDSPLSGRDATAINPYQQQVAEPRAGCAYSSSVAADKPGNRRLALQGHIKPAADAFNTPRLGPSQICWN